MSYQVLARKWRPKNFKELIGQEHVVRALTHALNENRLHHAYLFTGTRGVGKTTIARILAKALNCEKGISAEPCGVCGACTEINEGRFVDLLEVDAATNTRVEEMRTLLENAVYAPTRGRFKVYVIDEVHMLSTAAFNAMLKTLEEPPEHVKFILATTDPQKIPVTVLSRCLQFNLKQMTTADAVFQIKKILTEEKIPFDEKALPLIAKAGQGSMRDSLSILDQAIAYGAGEVSAEQVAQMLGAVEHDFLFHILDALLNQNPARLLEIAQNLNARAVAFSLVLQEFGLLLTRIQTLQFAPKSFEDDSDIEKLREIAAKLPPEWVQLAYQIVNIGRREMPLSPDPESGFLMTLLRLYAFRPAEFAGGGIALKPAAAPAFTQVSQNAIPRPAAPAQNFQNPPAIPTKLGANPAADILKIFDEKDKAEKSQKKSALTVENPQKEPEKTPPVENVEKSPAIEKAPLEIKEYAPAEWPGIVENLNLKSIALVLAQSVELVKLTNAEGVFNVSPDKVEILGADSFARQTLEKALATFFENPNFKLDLRAVEPVGKTILQQKAEVRQAAQDSAKSALENDPFVSGMQKEFSALIDWDSVRAME